MSASEHFTAGAEAPTSQIEDHLNRVEAVVVDVHKVAMRLRERLAPALRPTAPEPANEHAMLASAPDPRCPIADRLEATEGSITEAVMIFHDLLQRLEL